RMRMPGIFGALGSRLINPSAELDEDALTQIADATGGRYFRARDSAALKEIYGIIDALEAIEQDPETYRPTAALYFWPLGLAWALACALLLPAPNPSNHD
ncbi:MAG: BatB protein, partial [Gammaproteobacteria bacterium]|nr:BatB protein [Gammaproteobacteria bacterium]